MELKYRIKTYTFPFCRSIYFAQYKIFGMWMYINSKLTGNLFRKKDCTCYSSIEAKKRIKRHKQNMERAKDWSIKGVHIEDF